MSTEVERMKRMNKRKKMMKVMIKTEAILNANYGKSQLHISDRPLSARIVAGLWENRAHKKNGG
ncbi:hypothetical protein [Halobacillus naozhouensis]|uniref:Uncharacterized protein n=1 Tax=Halobacillus naozhouensis TaxID=554880 RepID=A0ABY8IVF1_9BACI|nr:hypothetical protein [Halobacillus naozhouensis]WFT74148.1 hypothetical protein P9989_17530 [Halobacillus naozhouensis]